MAINFPDTPALNQQFTVGASTWQWDGTAWNIVPQMAPVNGMDTPPVNPVVGQMWWRSSNGQLYIYYDDGNSKQWVMTSPGLYQQTKTARQHNLIVNPAMAVSQENGSTAGNVTLYYPVDQWRLVLAGGIVCSAQQVASLTSDLSPSRIRKTVTTLKTTLATTDSSAFQQPIEGTRISCLGYGSAAAIQSVLRFGFKGPAGTYSAAVLNGPLPATRSYVKNFTISAAQANTDTIQTFVISGDTTGTWLADASGGMYLTVSDAVGPTYQGVEGWQAGFIMGTANNNNLVSTNGNIVELFDVGLYPDPDRTGIAPPFVAPLYSAALIDCMRYYIYYTAYAKGSRDAALASGQLLIGFNFPVPMRAPPSMSYNAMAGSAEGESTQVAYPQATLSAFTRINSSGTQFYGYVVSGTNTAVNVPWSCTFVYKASARM